MGFAADLIFIAIVLLGLVWGYKRGFFRSVVSLLGAVVVLVLSVWLSQAAAQWIFQDMLREPMISRIAQSLQETSAEDMATAVYAALPDAFSNALEFYGITAESLNETIAQTSGSAAGAAVDLMAPAVISVLKAILSLVLFILLTVLMHVLVRTVCRVLRLPLLRQLDRGMGAVLGLVQGALAVYVLCFCVQLLSPVAVPWMQEMMKESQVYHLFSRLMW